MGWLGTSDRRYRYRYRDMELEEPGEEDIVEALRKFSSVQRLMWGLTHDEPDLELVERLCRYKSRSLAVMAASLLTMMSKVAAFVPADVTTLFGPLSRDADPVECFVERVGDTKYRVRFLNTRGEEFCTEYEILQGKWRYLAYPCPVSTGLKRPDRPDGLVDLLGVVGEHRELKEREDEG